LSLVDSQLQNSLNLIQLYTAMGGGWDQLPLPNTLASPAHSASTTGATTP
jgi:outer membrane protein TolC